MKDIKVFLRKKKKKGSIWWWEYDREWYKNLPEDEKSVEKNIIEWEKTSYYNYKKLLFWKIMT